MTALTGRHMTCPLGRVRAIGKRNGFFLAFLFPIALLKTF